MNILCCNPPGGAFLHITNSWGNIFNSLGHKFLKWDGDINTADKFKPDLYLGCSGHRQDFPSLLRDKYNTKIGIHVNPWSKKPIPKFRDVDVNETKNSINWTLRQNPDFVFCYADKIKIDEYFNEWIDRHNLPVIPMPCAGDPILFEPVSSEKKYECDIGFVGGYWKYKSFNLDRFITPLTEVYDVKIWGWGGWKNKSYIGKINDEDIKKVFSSAKICPAISEPHTNDTGIDVPERIFKVPLGGGFVISDFFNGIYNYFPKEIMPVAKNYKELRELIDIYINSMKLRTEMKKAQQLHIIKNHTYYSRIRGIFEFLKRGNDVKMCDVKIEELVLKHMASK